MNSDTGFLNAFRAVAAFWVLTAHCAIWGNLTFPNWLDPKSAVDVFIVLSGFLMMLVSSQPERRGWGIFFVRRFFRIAPLYYLVLAIVVFLQEPFLYGYQQLIALNPEKWSGSAYDPSRIEYDATNILLHVSFVFGLLPEYSSSTRLPDWSIGLEMQFYVAFPLIFMAQRRIGPLAIGITGAALAAGCIWAYSQLVKNGIANYFIEPSLLGFKLHMFMVGILLFAGWKEPIPLKRLALFGAAIGICIAQYRLFGVRSLTVIGVVVAMTWLLSPSRLAPTGALTVRRFLGGRFFGFFADLSYSAYLLHGLFLAIFGGSIASLAKSEGWSAEARVLAIWAVVFPCTYAASWMTYSLVERPMISFGRRKGRR